MKSIKIGDKTFRLASPFKRLLAFFLDITHIVSILAVSLLLLNIVDSSALQIGLFSALLWILGPKARIPKQVLVIAQLLLVYILGPWGNRGPWETQNWDAIYTSGAALGIAGLLLMDGFKNGQGFGKQLLSLQVRRLRDGKPATFKDSFVRRFVGIFQPLDFCWAFGKEGQRLGDKLAETVVVHDEPEPEVAALSAEAEPEPEALSEKAEAPVVVEDPERVLADAIAEMRQKLSEAREKVDAALAVENDFQDAYDGAIAQAERWHDRATLSLEAGREDLAREDLGKRNEYRRLAEHHKTQWDSQKEIVRALNDLLEHFQQKIVEAEGKRAVAMAQQRNIEAEAHLRGMLNEIERSDALMVPGTSDAAMLAKAAAEVDTVYQNIQLEREFAGYAEEASLDEDLAKLKAEINK